MRDVHTGSYQKGCMHPEDCASSVCQVLFKYVHRIQVELRPHFIKTLFLNFFPFFFNIFNFHRGRQQTEWTSPFPSYLLLPCWECRCKSIFLPSLSFSKKQKTKTELQIFRKRLVKALAEARRTGEESRLILLLSEHVFILGTSNPFFFQLIWKVWWYSLFFYCFQLLVSPCCTR